MAVRLLLSLCCKVWVADSVLGAGPGTHRRGRSFQGLFSMRRHAAIRSGKWPAVPERWPLWWSRTVSGPNLPGEGQRRLGRHVGHRQGRFAIIPIFSRRLGGRQYLGPKKGKKTGDLGGLAPPWRQIRRSPWWGNDTNWGLRPGASNAETGTGRCLAGGKTITVLATGSAAGLPLKGTVCGLRKAGRGELVNNSCFFHTNPPVREGEQVHR